MATSHTVVKTIVIAPLHQQRHVWIIKVTTKDKNTKEELDKNKNTILFVIGVINVL